VKKKSDIKIIKNFIEKYEEKVEDITILLEILCNIGEDKEFSELIKKMLEKMKYIIILVKKYVTKYIK